MVRTISNRVLTKVSGLYHNKGSQIALVVMASLLAYALAFDNGFINLDDPVMIYNNHDIQTISLDQIKHWFTSLHEDLYHPLTSFSLALNYQLSGTQAWSYHLANILLHVLNTFLLWVFISKLTSRGLAFWTALLFGIHPVHVESVAWASERKDMLYAFFCFLALVRYLAYLRHKSGQNLFAVLFLFMLSLMAKPMAITLPASLLAIDYLKKRDFRKTKLYIEKTPFLLLSTLALYILYRGQTQEGIVVHGIDFTLTSRMAFGAYGLAHYIYHILAPHSLSLIYPYPTEHEGMLPAHFYYYLAAPLLFAALLSYLLFWRKDRLLAFGLLFFMINIALVMQVYPVGFLMADRYAYVASAGIILGMVILVKRLYPIIKAQWAKLALNVLVLAYAGFLFASAFQRADLWHESTRLWDDVIEKQPLADLAWTNRANEHFRAGRYEKALQDYNMAIKLDPYVLHSWFNRGLIHYEMGNYGQAVSDMSVALHRSNTVAPAWYIRGLANLEMGNRQQACSDLKNALELGYKDAHKYLRRYCGKNKNVPVRIPSPQE